MGVDCERHVVNRHGRGRGSSQTSEHIGCVIITRQQGLIRNSSAIIRCSKNIPSMSSITANYDILIR